MGFIAKQGAGGFISGNAFVKSSSRGRLAFMQSGKVDPWALPFIKDSAKDKIIIISNSPITATDPLCGWTYSVNGGPDTAPISAVIGTDPDSLTLTMAAPIVCGDKVTVSYNTFGNNLVVNGKFSDGDASWTYDANVAITDRAFFDSTNGALSQVIVGLVTGNDFQLIFDVLPGAVFGGAGLAIFLDGDGANVNTVGNHTITLVPSNTDGTLVFESITPGDFEGEIDNIYLREIT